MESELIQYHWQRKDATNIQTNSTMSKLVNLQCPLQPEVLVFSMSMFKSTRWAVVTGCTGGIGRAYVLAMAAKGMDIVLVIMKLMYLYVEGPW